VLFSPEEHEPFGFLGFEENFSMQPEGSKNSESPDEGKSALPIAASEQPMSSPLQNENSDDRGASLKKGGLPDFRRIWMNLTPFFLSAILYLSGFFAVFAPLPLLVQRYLGAPLVRRLLASITNGGIAFLLGDAGAVVLYGILVLPVVWFLPLLFEKTRKPETAILLTAGSVLVAAAIAMGVAAGIHGGDPWSELNSTFDGVLRQVHEAVPLERRSELLGDQTLEEWMAATKLDMPWRMLTILLFWVFANGMILLRWNPRHIRERLGLAPRYFADWKAPEFLILPVLVGGALMVFGKTPWNALGTNILYTALAVYAIQGLSIMSFLMDRWGLFGPLRSILYGIGLLVMLPLILAAGFFDTWFDFRERLRQR